MNKLLGPGRAIFAIGMIALGILCFVFKDFIVGRPPEWPSEIKVNPALAYISGAILIVAALAVLLNKYTRPAALLMAAMILALSVCRHLTTFMTTWPNGYKSIALVGGCLIIAATARQNNRIMILSGTVLLALFLLVCGYSHFKYADFVDTLIPAYIPFHHFWTYFCGFCLCVGGLGLLIPATRNMAALLSGIMIGGWFLLLHIPRFLANTNDTSDRLGVCESFTFCGIFFVLAALTAKKNN